MDQLTALLLAAQRGDRDALERFVAATQRDVVAMCRYLGDHDNADDLAQEAYERAISSLHRYRATGPAKHWMLTITRHTCADATRTRKRRRKLNERVANLAHDDVVEPISGHTQAELDGFLLQLDDDRRAAFVVTQIIGLSYEEAADLLDVPIGTIRSRVARAREQLVGVVTAAGTRTDSEPTTLRRRPHG